MFEFDLINRLKLIKRLYDKKAFIRFKTGLAYLSVSRKLFVSDGLGDPYSLNAFELRDDVTITCPLFVARMVELIPPYTHRKNNKVLEIGTGTGFQTAILAKIGYEVTTIERLKWLFELSQNNLAKSKIKNVKQYCQDGSKGCKNNGPYTGIIMGCAVPEVPYFLIDQLEIGGKLIAPIGIKDAIQTLTVYSKTEKGFDTQKIRAAWFVPLITD